MVMGSLREFEYVEPASLEEAISILGSSENARVLAGGTDLILGMREKKIEPRAIVNIKRIPGLDRMQIDELGSVRIGALVTMDAIERSEFVQTAFPILAHAAHTLGSFQIRNRATIGGNLCNASPAADTAPPLIALRAIVKIVGAKGERLVKLEDFFEGPGKTVLSRDEVLTEVEVPSQAGESYGAYLKHGPRNAMDIATVNAAMMFTLHKQKCTEARIALGSVAPVPLRARKAETEIHGKMIDESSVRRVAEVASEECSPISDLRGSAEYRKAMVKVLVRRLFGNALRPRFVESKV
jgi:carbon-monoxide dehydrogenase medium subunit